MQISSAQLAKTLIVSLEDGVAPAKLAESFQEYLASNHLTGLLPNILKHLDKEVRRIEESTAARITISHEVSAAAVKLIEKLVGKTGGDASIVSVDPALIGGFRATYRGKLFDGSVKHYLEAMRTALLN